MASSRFAFHCLAPLAFAVVAGGASAQVYKCQDAQGKTSYQQQPCDSPGAKSTTMVEPPPRAAGASAPAATAPGGAVVPPKPDTASETSPVSTVPPNQRRMVTPGSPPDATGEPSPNQPPKYTLEHVFMVGGVVACRDMPDFGSRIAPNYSRWRAVHAEAVAEFERTPDYARIVKEAKAAPRDGARERQCRDLEASLALEWGPPDPRLATPEMTWRTFTTALRGGDQRVVAETMVGDMDAILQGAFPEMRTKLLPSVNGVKLTRVEKGNDGNQTGYFTKPKGGEGRVEFLRTGTNWRIAGLVP